MTTIAKDTGSDFTLTPEGTHIARCVQVIDKGTQTSEFYGTKHKILLGFELPDAADAAGEPPLVWREYNLSLHAKASLRCDLESWRGRQFSAKELAGFDLKKLLGVGCMISVVHQERDGRTFANVQSVMKLPKGTDAPPQVSELRYYDIDAHDDCRDAFDTFSDNLREAIMRSAEMQARNGDGQPLAEAAADVAEADEVDIPF